MNDENNEEEFGMEFRAFPLQELFQGMQAQQDHVQMHADVVKHEMMDFVRNLSKEQLIILDHFAGLFVAAPDAGRYYQGVIAATLENKFNVCAACRQDHDEQAQEIFNASGAQAEAEKEKAKGARPWSDVKAEAEANMTSEERAVYDKESKKPLPEERIVFEDPSTFAGLERLRVEKHNEKMRIAAQSLERHIARKMEEYNVEPWGDNLLPDQKDTAYPPSSVRCKNCGMQYVSLEDRMLKGPEKVNCDGCIQKEKTG